jgi:transglutaminase-like putative cysteine protease
MMTDEELQAAREPTWFLDADSPEIKAFAAEAVGDETDPTKQAVKLFYAVRDGSWYSPYTVTDDPADYRASALADRQAMFCVPKAILLTAAARSVGIPARLGFADVRNHLNSDKLRARMGTDLFMYHGYTALYLDGRWLKVTPAFNAELCERFGVRPLEFDGTEDALFHEFTDDGTRHMEYVRYRGEFDDMPFDEIMDNYRSQYGALMNDGAGPSSPDAGRGTGDRFDRPT